MRALIQKKTLKKMASSNLKQNATVRVEIAYKKQDFNEDIEHVPKPRGLYVYFGKFKVSVFPFFLSFFYSYLYFRLEKSKLITIRFYCLYYKINGLKLLGPSQQPLANLKMERTSLYN